MRVVGHATSSSRPRRIPTPEQLSPGYFAMVMATGIVAIGAGQRGWHTLSVIQVELSNAEGKLVATGTFTFFMMDQW